MEPFQWAVCIVMGCLFGSLNVWAYQIHERQLEIRAELRRINQAYQTEIDKVVGRHH
jgi:hypothetical protein